MKAKIFKKANKFAKEHASLSLDNFEYDEVHDCLKLQGDMGYFEEYSGWNDFFAESLGSGLEIVGLSKEQIKYFFENNLENEVLPQMCDTANAVFENYLEEFRK